MEHNALAQQFTPMSILKFALPNIVMMIFLSLYTIVDGIFISRLVGELALSATNMFYPVTSVQLAIGVMFGTGGSAVIARKLGEKGNEEAREDFTSIVLTAFLIGLFCLAVCLPLLDPLLDLLGVSTVQRPDTVIYARIMLIFSPLMFLQTVFQIFFVAAGKPGLGLTSTMVGGLANMVLDYLFMGPLHMGVAGAAVATGIGYCVPAFTGLLYFSLNRKGSLHFVKFKFRPKMLLRTCLNGSSEMVSNVAMAVTTFLFNVIFMSFWREDGVAAITILSYFQFVFSAIFMGFSMGVSPIISFKYGADDRPQIKRLVKFSLGFVLAASVGVYLISRLTIQGSLAIFTQSGGAVYQLALGGFGLYAIQFLFMGVSIFASALFTAFGNGLVSALISMARTFVFLAGSLLILPRIWGETGVWYAVPTAEFLGLLVSVAFLLWGRREYPY